MHMIAISSYAYNLMSLPHHLNVRDLNQEYNDTTICRGCTVSVELTRSDLFGQEWIPYKLCNRFIVSKT